jgi:hypothetical protein
LCHNATIPQPRTIRRKKSLIQFSVAVLALVAMLGPPKSHVIRFTRRFGRSMSATSPDTYFDENAGRGRAA